METNEQEDTTQKPQWYVENRHMQNIIAQLNLTPQANEDFIFLLDKRIIHLSRSNNLEGGEIKLTREKVENLQTELKIVKGNAKEKVGKLLTLIDAYAQQSGALTPRIKEGGKTKHIVDVYDF